MLFCESEEILSKSSQLASGAFLDVLPILGYIRQKSSKTLIRLMD